MKTKKLRVSLSFSNGSDGDLECTARNVLNHAYDNPSFTDIPVSAASLKATIAAFSATREIHVKGGRSATFEKNTRRIALVRLLQQVAFYVQTKSGDDLPKLRSSGFEHVGPHHQPAASSLLTT